MKNTLIFLILAFLAAACGGVAEGPPPTQAPPVLCDSSSGACVRGTCQLTERGNECVDPDPEPQSCDVFADGWHISLPGLANPDPASCRTAAPGHYVCPPQDCTPLPYVGTCPHCGGGGE